MERCIYIYILHIYDIIKYRGTNLDWIETVEGQVIAFWRKWHKLRPAEWICVKEGKAWENTPIGRLHKIQVELKLNDQASLKNSN